MSRIRSIHPGWFTDEAVVSVSMAARVLSIGLLTEADDHGVFEWKPLGLKMRLFPADNVDVLTLLRELERANIIMIAELEGKYYGLIRNFCIYQRPKHPSYRFPFPVEWRCYTGCKAGKSVVDEYPSDSPPPGGGEASPTTTEKPPQMERREEERREEEGSVVVSARERSSSKGPPPPDQLLGTKIDAAWMPKPETIEELSEIVGKLDAGPAIDRFVAAHLESGMTSKDWDARLLTEARKAKPIERKRTRQAPPKAPPRYEVNNHATTGDAARIAAARSLIRPEAHKLAKDVCEALGIPKDHPFNHGLPMECESWLADGWDAEVCLLATKQFSARRPGFIPNGFAYLRPVLARAHADLKNRMPVVASNAQENIANARAPQSYRSGGSLIDSINRSLDDLARELEATRDSGEGEAIDLPAAAVRLISP